MRLSAVTSTRRPQVPLEPPSWCLQCTHRSVLLPKANALACVLRDQLTGTRPWHGTGPGEGDARASEEQAACSAHTLAAAASPPRVPTREWGCRTQVLSTCRLPENRSNLAAQPQLPSRTPLHPNSCFQAPSGIAGYWNP